MSTSSQYSMSYHFLCYPRYIRSVKCKPSYSLDHPYEVLQTRTPASFSPAQPCVSIHVLAGSSLKGGTKTSSTHLWDTLVSIVNMSESLDMPHTALLSTNSCGLTFLKCVADAAVTAHLSPKTFSTDTRARCSVFAMVILVLENGRLTLDRVRSFRLSVMAITVIVLLGAWGVEGRKMVKKTQQAIGSLHSNEKAKASQVPCTTANLLSAFHEHGSRTVRSDVQAWERVLGSLRRLLG